MGTLAAGMKEIFSSAQTTATHLPTCSSDGTPTGRISTSDLASVLGVMKGIKRWRADDVSQPIVTDIPANAGDFGNTVLIMASDHFDVGDTTASALYLLRIGYSGDNISLIKVVELHGASTQESIITASVENGHVALKGFRRYLTIECKI